MIKKFFLIFIVMMTLSFTGVSVWAITLNPSTTGFSVEQNTSGFYIVLDDLTTVNNSELNNLDIAISFGNYTNYGEFDEEENFLLNGYTEFYSNESSFQFQSYKLPILLNSSGFYFLQLGFQDSETATQTNYAIDFPSNFTYNASIEVEVEPLSISQNEVDFVLTQNETNSNIILADDVTIYNPTEKEVIGYFSAYCTPEGEDVVTIGENVPAFLFSSTTFVLSEFSLPITSNCSGYYTGSVLFSDGSDNVLLNFSQYYYPPMESVEDEGSIGELNVVISLLFGVLATTVAAVTDLTINSIVILIIIGAFVSVIIGIIYALRSKIMEYLKFK